MKNDCFRKGSKNWADRSPVSSTFLQRKVTSHSSYKNLHPPNALPSYTTFENANSRAVLEMSRQSGRSEDCYVNLRNIMGTKPSSPAKHSKNTYKTFPCFLKAVTHFYCFICSAIIFFPRT